MSTVEASTSSALAINGAMTRDTIAKQAVRGACHVGEVFRMAADTAENTEHGLDKERRFDKTGIDAVAFYEKPLTHFVRLLRTYLGEAPAGFRSFHRALRGREMDNLEFAPEAAAMGFGAVEAMVVMSMVGDCRRGHCHAGRAQAAGHLLPAHHRRSDR